MKTIGRSGGSSGSSVGEAEGYAQECLLFQADEGLLSRTVSHVREHQRLSIEKAKAGGKVETQRLVFTGEAISALKSQLTIDHPSRTVAIAGLIWKAALDARSRRAPTASAAVSLVNVRPRLKTPLPDGCIGNLYWITTAVAETSGDPGMEHFANRVKESVGRVDGELLEKLAAGVEAHRQFHEQLEGLAASNTTDDSASLYKFFSILRMGLSQVDFGWGKPSWVTILGFTADDVAPVPNLVCLMEATAGGGAVEAWVSLDEQEMPIFLQHPHLLQYATVNPRIQLIP
ncbi:unnamed protein product [Linum tenue]|uniref:Uncharacterized protein n=1 Tax=Linum tenue TaxID=586396 RepID=A0AAV0NG60_9ROSI|nr:unnamed protein product [Linum tenue]